MRMLKADLLDGEEPLSKALNSILKTGTAVIVTKNGKYYGLVDDRDIRQGLTNTSRAKAINAAVRAPCLEKGASLEETMRSFMAGHFKALPVVESGRVKGIVTRADVMNEMKAKGVVPRTTVSALMASPLYTVDRGETLGIAKNLMKKLGVHHLAVTSRGRVVGSLSTFDLSVVLLKPRERQRFVLISEVSNADSRPVHEYMRENLVTARSHDSLIDAVGKMAKNNVSRITVIDEDKAVGLLSATDIMKFVLSMVSESPNIFISGIPHEDMPMYGSVRGTLEDALKKFRRTFEIGDVHVHFKKGKSMYAMSTRVEVGHGTLVVHSEAHDMKTVVGSNAREIKRLLNKRKNYKRDKRKHYRTEGFYEGAG